tara:strand:+ start:6384 stop:6980 length:597 start_codon:yes stop_codon:yes gene_type:complete
MTIILLLGLLVGLIMLGAPIGFALAFVPTGYIIATGEVPWTMVPYTMYEALSFASLAAIPFFMLTGELMTSATITDHLIEFSRALVGRARGGLAQVNIVVSMFFAGLNGSVIADTATIGSILIPAMKRAGYSSAFSAAITSVSATIGGIIPPVRRDDYPCNSGLSARRRRFCSWCRSRPSCGPYPHADYCDHRQAKEL